MAEAVQSVKPKKQEKRKKKEKKSADSELIKLCPAYLSSSGCDRGEMCDDLHICRNYILQKCRSADGGPCSFSHDLQSNQSRGLFQRRFGIYPLAGKVLQKFKMLFGATIQDPPKEFADESSRAAWEMARQIDQDKLRNFLLPVSFTDNDEKTSTAKSESHSNNEKQSECVVSSSEVSKPDLKQRDIQLQDKRMSESVQNENASSTQKRHTSLEIPTPQGFKADEEKPSALAAISNPSPTSLQQSELGEANSQLSLQKDPQICLYYLRGCCSREQAHEHYRHLSSKFQWQIRDGLRRAWLDLTQEANLKMEKYYCDVSNAEYTGQLKAYCGENNTDIFNVHKVTITFGPDTLTVSDKTGQFVDVRRISTMSHGQEESWIKAFSTHWKWYWQNGHENWIEYPDQPSDDEDQFPNTRSTSIEERYLKFKYKQGPSQFEVTTDYGKFQLDFSRMEKTSLPHNHLGPYPLARRPTWNPQIDKLSSEGQSNPNKPSIHTSTCIASPEKVKEPSAQASHSKEPDAPVPKSSKKPDHPRELNCLQEELPSAPLIKLKVQVARSCCTKGQASQSGAGTEETPRQAAKEQGAQPRSVDLNDPVFLEPSAFGLHSKKSEVAVKPKDASVLPQSSVSEAISDPLHTSPQQPELNQANSPPAHQKDLQICPCNLRGCCSCEHVHLPSTFQWQIRDSFRGIWLDLTQQENLKLEEYYCDIGNVGCIGPIKAYCGEDNTDIFNVHEVSITFGPDSVTVSDKTGQFVDIRRISAMSHGQAGGLIKAFSNHWKWYWQDGSKNWIEYPVQKPSGDKDQSPNTRSTSIEKRYLKFKHKQGPSQFEVTTDYGKFQLDFSRMEQTSLLHSHLGPYPLARRPTWNPQLHIDKLSSEGQSYPAKPGIQTTSISTPEKVEEPSAQACHSKEPDSPVPKSSMKPNHPKLICLLEEPPSAPLTKPKVQISHSSCAKDQASQSGADTDEETPRNSAKEPGTQPRSEDSNHLVDREKSTVGLDSKKSEVAVKLTDASFLPPSSGNKSSSHSEVQEETTQICLHFLCGQCKYGSDTSNHDRHLQTPYQWQFIDGAERGLGWQDFDRDLNSAVERSFCDVNTTVFHNIIDPFDKRLSTIQFENNPMIGVCSSIHIRRLSTPSRVLQGSWRKAFCMEWIWYWQDERGIWTIYSEQNAQGVRAGIDSSAIEQKYLEFKNEHGKSEIEFTAGSQRYRLDFAAMKQTNISYGTSKEVRRRPNFIPMAERHKLSRELLQAETSGVIVPATWDNCGTQTGLRLVTLTDRLSPEYRAIADLFWETMSTRDTIVSIDRIQNLELWEDFSKMSERMKKKNGGKPVLQKRLFHGTATRTYANAICRQNFDWRLSGTNVGTLHGKGSYFSRDAEFAHSYTEADDNDNRYVFVAQVLVGSLIAGSSSYVRPPPKDPWNDPHGDLYDCCVDNVQEPKIFVIFEKSQVYPEYLITYEREPSYVYSPLYQQTGNNWRQSTYTANPFSSTPRPTAQAFTNPYMYSRSRSYSPPPPFMDKSSCTIQ